MGRSVGGLLVGGVALVAEFVGPLLPGRGSVHFIGPLLPRSAAVLPGAEFVGPVLPVGVHAAWLLNQVPGVRRSVAVALLDTPGRGEPDFEPAGGVDGVGLSSYHISPKLRADIAALDPVREKVGYARVRVAHGGGVVRCSTTGAAPARAVFDARRGTIAGFSASSRRRLMDLTASINRTKCGLPKFMTLTYPGVWSPDAARWKVDLDSFGKRLVRRWPSASMIWRLEFQKRGAPHFHCLVFGVPYLPRTWVARAWAMVVTDLSLVEQRVAVNWSALLAGMQFDQPGPRAALLGLLSPAQRMYLWHRAAGTQVVRVKSWRGVASYTAKGMAHELGKLDQAVCDAGGVGRWWGVVNRDKLPVDVETVVIALEVFWKLRRILRRLGGRPGVGRWQGIAAFVGPPTIDKLVRWLGAHI
jgi:hypothetical protein